MTERPPLFTSGELVAGRFRILGVLGTGGGGQVFEAEDLLLGRRVALKAIHPELASDPGALERLRREVLLAGEVTDPHVCRTFDVARHEFPRDRNGRGGETLVAAMERLEGETLARRLRRAGPLDEAEAASVTEQLARGLAAAHAAGVLHLDLKSANVLLTRRRGTLRAVVTDFGLAVSSRRAGGGAASFRGGTPGYMAPEQRRGEPPSAASDVYALGCVLHELFTGSLPGAPGGRGEPRVPRRWRALLASCLAERAEDRPADGAALVREIARVVGRPPIRSRALRGVRVLRAAGLTLLLLSLRDAGPEGGAPGASSPDRLSPPLDSLRATGRLEPAAARAFTAGLEALRELDGRRALAFLDQAVEREPTSALAHAVLSEAWTELGHTARAREAAARALELGSPSRATRLFLEARRLETDRAWDEAAERRRALHALFPDDPEHAIRRVVAAAASGAPREAESVLSGLLEAGAASDLEPLLRALEGEVARGLNDAERQLRAARRAIRTGEAQGQMGVVARGRLLEGAALRRLGREDHGRAATESARRLYDELGNEGGRLRALVQLALLESEVEGNAAGATAGYQEALELARELRDPKAEGEILALLGAEAWELGGLDLAERRYLRARELFRRLDEQPGLARVAGNLALVHLTRGSFQQAEREFEEALRLRRLTGPPSAAAPLLGNLGALYARRGEVRRARDTWTEAGNLARESGHLLVAVLVATNLAELALQSGDLPRAAEILREEAEPHLESLSTPAFTAQTLLLEGAIAFFVGDEREAVELSTDALDTLEEAGDRVRAARAQLQLAQIHDGHGRLAQAESLARAAIRRLEGTGEGGLLVLGRYRLLCALLGQGRLREAEPLLRALEAEAPEGSSEDDWHRVLLSAMARGRYALSAGDPATAVAEVERSLAELPPRWLVPYRFEARLVLAAAEAARAREEASQRGLRELAADAQRSGFVWFAREAHDRLAQRRHRETEVANVAAQGPDSS